ncbi:GNVR domain-containing protein, partial [Klebsiella pneumoniae]|uniref:GNVR domain-containing protein n=2 Tax=Klebsiella/Raoultella group TaxID=2890311 RepID=UPI0021CD003E
MTPIVNNKTQQAESDDFDLGRLLGELIDNRKLIISITSAFTVLAVLYTLLATPIYQADALIQVEQKQGNAILNSINQILPNSQPESAPELTLLQSRMILGKTVDDLNLQAQVRQKYFPVIGRGVARLLGEESGSITVGKLYLPQVEGGDAPQVILTVNDGERYTIAGDDFTLEGKVGELINEKGVTLLIKEINAQPGSEFVITYLNKLKAISNLQDAFNVADQGKDTGMLSLTLTGDNPTLIKNILNSISNNYLEQNVERQAAQDAKSLDFLNEQLPKVRSDLDFAEDKLNAYRKQKDSVDLTMEAKSVLDQIVNVDNQLNELTFKEAEISQLYTKEHPTYKALVEKRKTLQDEKVKLNKRVSSMPSTQQEVLRLSRDVESGRAVYLQLLNRQQELNIAKSSAIGNVRIVDDAVTEPNPVKPKKILIIIIGTILGAFISIGIVLLRMFLLRGIESPEQLEEAGINVYASVPVAEWYKANLVKGNNKRKEPESLLAIENPADLAIEAIRSLRTSLHFAMMEAKNNILMISGASPNAGKTFISTNLAATMASSGKKVLFIDADLRKGYVHKILGSNNDNGLSDYLSGRVSLEKVITTVTKGNFDYIPRGQVPPN